MTSMMMLQSVSRFDSSTSPTDPTPPVPFALIFFLFEFTSAPILALLWWWMPSAIIAKLVSKLYGWDQVVESILIQRGADGENDDEQDETQERAQKSKERRNVRGDLSQSLIVDKEEERESAIEAAEMGIVDHSIASAHLSGNNPQFGGEVRPSFPPSSPSFSSSSSSSSSSSTPTYRMRPVTGRIHVLGRSIALNCLDTSDPSLSAYRQGVMRDTSSCSCSRIYIWILSGLAAFLPSAIRHRPIGCRIVRSVRRMLWLSSWLSRAT